MKTFIKKGFFFVLIISVFSSNAQNFELGKVSIAELKESAHPQNPLVPAAILYKRARTTFQYTLDNGFSTVHEYEYRIKIYKTEGLTWADFQVPFYIGYENLNKDKVKFSDAVTYNLENDKIIKTKLNSEGSFKRNVNEYWAQASITMPNVRVGSVIEFKYTLKSERIIDFPVFNFQEAIPVNLAAYKTEIPGFFNYKAILKGPFEVDLDSKIANGSQNYNGKNNESLQFTYTQSNNIYTAEHVPALEQEVYVDNIENYKSSLQNELQSSQFNKEPMKNYSLTWDGVAKTIFEDKEFGDEIKQIDYFASELKNQLTVILKATATTTEKINLILSFLKSKVKWNGKNGYSTDKGVVKAYAEGTGNVAEINFMLISMLNYAGIKSYPVLVSTRDHGIAVYPSRTVFNYVIVSVAIDGKNVLLDATNKNSTLDILPLNVINWKGRLIRNDGTSEEIVLIPKIPSKQLVDIIVSINPIGTIEGKVRVYKTDYEAFEFRDNYSGINKENYLEKLEAKSNGIQINNYKIENEFDVNKPITETFNFDSDNHLEIIGDKIYINPLLFFTEYKNPFVQEKRNFPIYFAYPKLEKYNVNIDIPEGYALESLPTPVAMTMVENIGKFSYKIAVVANKIQVSFTSEINLASVPAEYYDTLKEFYQKMIDKQNEKIVLKKI